MACSARARALLSALALTPLTGCALGITRRAGSSPPTSRRRDASSSPIERTAFAPLRPLPLSAPHLTSRRLGSPHLQVSYAVHCRFLPAAAVAASASTAPRTPRKSKPQRAGAVEAAPAPARDSARAGGDGVGESLQRSLEKRPSRSDLAERNVVPRAGGGAAPAVAPSLEAARAKLARALTRSALRRRLEARQTPRELRAAGVLKHHPATTPAFKAEGERA